VYVFAFFLNTRRIYTNFFQDLGENTCSLQPALKSTAPAFKERIKHLNVFNAF